MSSGDIGPEVGLVMLLLLLLLLHGGGEAASAEGGEEAGRVPQLLGVVHRRSRPGENRNVAIFDRFHFSLSLSYIRQSQAGLVPVVVHLVIFSDQNSKSCSINDLCCFYLTVRVLISCLNVTMSTGEGPKICRSQL